MKLYLISFTPGYSADFLASLIHKDEKFYNIDNVERSSDNRFMFPNFTKTFFSKMTQDISKFKLDDDYKYLKETYGKNLCINAHMFEEIKGPYEKKIKIFGSSERSKRIAYTMWWYKSHIENELPTQERYEKIINDTTVPEQLKTNYSKWKYLCWDKLKNVDMSLYNYIKEIYKFNSGAGGTKADFNDFENLDLDEWLYTDNINVSNINRIFDIQINKDKIRTYRDKNYKICKDIGVDPDSKYFFNQLYQYILKEMNDEGYNLYKSGCSIIY